MEHIHLTIIGLSTYQGDSTTQVSFFFNINSFNLHSVIYNVPPAYEYVLYNREFQRLWLKDREAYVPDNQFGIRTTSSFCAHNANQLPRHSRGIHEGKLPLIVLSFISNELDILKLFNYFSFLVRTQIIGIARSTPTFLMDELLICESTQIHKIYITLRMILSINYIIWLMLL